MVTYLKGSAGGMANIDGRVTRSGRVMSAGDMRGDRVLNLAGEHLGHIEELMLDVDDGLVAYAVVSAEERSDTGDTLFAVPWRALSVIQHEEHFILDMGREDFERAPAFDREAWPDFSDRVWGRKLHDHYGTVPTWNPAFPTAFGANEDTRP